MIDVVRRLETPCEELPQVGVFVSVRPAYEAALFGWLSAVSFPLGVAMVSQVTEPQKYRRHVPALGNSRVETHTPLESGLQCAWNARPIRWVTLCILPAGHRAPPRPRAGGLATRLRLRRGGGVAAHGGPRGERGSSAGSCSSRSQVLELLQQLYTLARQVWLDRPSVAVQIKNVAGIL